MVKERADSVAISTIAFGITLVISFILKAIGIDKTLPEMIAGCFFVGITLILLILSGKILKNTNERIIFWLSYFLKIIYLTFQLKGVDITNPILDTDAAGFWRVASMYYDGNFGIVYTPFPYVINFEFHIFGKNLACCLLVNCFCSMLMVLVTYEVFNRLKICGKARDIGGYVICLLPFIILTCSLFIREPYYYVFIALSELEFIIHLLSKKRFHLYLAVLLSVPILVMHIGYFPIPLLCFISSIIINKPKNYNDLIKCIFEIAIFALCVILMMNSNSTHYIVNDNTSSAEGMLRKLSGTSYYEDTLNAGSAYLLNLQATTWSRVILYSPIRLVYFLFSPMPTNWRGLTDIITFLLDSIIHFYVLVQSLSYIKMKNRMINLGITENDLKKQIVVIGLWQVLLSSYIFAMGTATAGTAIRHRDVLIPIETIILAVSLSEKKKLREIKKKNRSI